MDHFNKDNINTNDKVSSSDLLFKVSEANKFPFTKDDPDDDSWKMGTLQLQNRTSHAQ